MTILLATRNGAAHLGAQLASYRDQDHPAWRLWVSDDGSDDGTRAMLERFRDRCGDRVIRIFDGPRAGASANFLSLLAHPDLPAGPVALSDQDDVWFPDRLSRGLRALQAAGPAAPALIGARTVPTDADLTPLRIAQAPMPTPSFGNALAQNVIAGNTIMMNAAALAVVRAALPVPPVPYHDWWLYLVLTGAGARVTLDAEPCLFYRQHGTNALGARHGARAGLSRLKLLLDGTYSGWLAQNHAALAAAADLLTPENRALLRGLRDSPGGLARLRAFRRAGMHRKSHLETWLIHGLALAGRV